MTDTKDNTGGDKTQAEQRAAIETPKTDTPAQNRLAFFSAVQDKLHGARNATTGAIATLLAARPRLSRVTVLAASITLAAALGSLVGAYAGVALMAPPEQATVPTLTANTFKGTFSQLSADIAALKATMESNNKYTTAQFSKIGERIDRAEKAQSEPAARLARIADTVDRLERKSVAAASASASAAIPLPVAAPGATLAAASPEVTGSIAPKQQDKPPVVAGWILRDAFNGRALVESRYGLYEIGPGAPLPGLGRVETIKRQDGRWVVVTPKGLIVAEQ